MQEDTKYIHTNTNYRNTKKIFPAGSSFLVTAISLEDSDTLSTLMLHALELK